MLPRKRAPGGWAARRSLRGQAPPGGGAPAGAGADSCAPVWALGWVPASPSVRPRTVAVAAKVARRMSLVILFIRPNAKHLHNPEHLRRPCNRVRDQP